MGTIRNVGKAESHLAALQDKLGRVESTIIDVRKRPRGESSGQMSRLKATRTDLKDEIASFSHDLESFKQNI